MQPASATAPGSIQARREDGRVMDVAKPCVRETAGGGVIRGRQLVEIIPAGDMPGNQQPADWPRLTALVAASRTAIASHGARMSKARRRSTRTGGHLMRSILAGLLVAAAVACGGRPVGPAADL